MTETEKKQSGWTLKRYAMLAGAGVGAVILLPLIIGVVVAIIADPEPTSIRFGIIRDIMLIILAMQGVLVIVALTALILQVARLVSLLQSEIKPILDDVKETADTAKGTAQFVGKNVTQPLIDTKAFLTGFSVFTREIFRIRRVTKKKPKDEIE